MAPVEVAVLSSFVGVTIRRRLASPGLVNVRFAPLPRLITDRALPVLVKACARPLTAVQRRAAARAVLSTSSGMLGDSARRSESTTDVVAGVFAELDEAAANDAAIKALASGGRALAEFAGLYHRYLDVVANAVRPSSWSRRRSRALRTRRSLSTCPVA